MSAQPVEYVYALYNFEAENPDEVSFRVGERVLVVEKDEAYGDGWYQGTNERGETGLFPFSYTTTDESAALMMLNGGFQPEEGAAQTAPAAGAASQGTTAYGAQDRGVMHSTMNDIENALSELNTSEPQQTIPGGNAEDDMEREFQARAAARAELARNAQKSLQSQEETAWKAPAGVGEPGTISNRQQTLATTGGGVKPLAMLELSDESEDEDEEDAIPDQQTAPPTLSQEVQSEPTIPGGPAFPTDERSIPGGDPFPSQPWPAARETHPEPVSVPTVPTVPPVPSVPTSVPTEEPAAKEPAAEEPAVVDASKWSIDDVVEWARSKDMDDTVLEKLREHEVNGASLLSLDINLLKEIDIIAYGRRFKLASAIDELRNSPATPAPPRASMLMTPAPVPGDKHRMSSGVPSGAPRGPPSGVPQDMPSGVPQGMPSGAPRGPPSGVPHAMPHVTPPSMPSGVPSGVRRGPPSGVPQGMQNAMPNGAPSMMERPRVSSGPMRPAPAIDIPQGINPTIMAAPVTAPAAAPTLMGKDLPARPSPYLGLPVRDEAFEPRAVPPDTPVAPEPTPTLGGYDPEPGPTSTLPFGDSSSLRPVMPNEPIAQPSVPSVSLDDPVYSGPTASDETDRQSVLNRIGSITRQGWVKKRGERYNRWNNRYLILHGMDLIVLRDPSADKVKNLIPLHGYKVVSDESVNAAGYTFKIVHDTQRTHYFSFEDATAMRGWMKAIMKATIGRDFSQPVISSYSNMTISLEEAQRMRPRPPSPTSRMRVQLENARFNPGQLTSKDAMVLTSLDKGNS